MFTKNRERLLDGDVARRFRAALLNRPEVKALLSDEHFSVDGTLIQAWASMKSFRPKDGSGEPPAPGRNGGRDFHGEKRSNATHTSATDPEARLFRKGKGKEARLCFLGHLLMENRHSLIVDDRLSVATGTAERDEAAEMVADVPGRHRITVGADRAYDTADFVAALRGLNATPHGAQNLSGRVSRIDRRTRSKSSTAVANFVSPANCRLSTSIISTAPLSPPRRSCERNERNLVIAAVSFVIARVWNSANSTAPCRMTTSIP